MWIGVAFAFVAAAATHVLAIARADPPVSRHALFVAINLATAAGVVLRPRGFAIAFAALTAQQLYSHGGAAIRAWRDEGRVDWPSVIVVVAMPVVLALLVRDRKRG